MQNQHILITNIASELSKQLVEQFRDDHINLESTVSIIGICNQEHPETQQDTTIPLTIINYDQDPNRVLKIALESDLVILDLVDDNEIAELIIKYLKNSGDERKRQVIAISSYITWAGHTYSEPNIEEDIISALNFQQETKQQTDSNFTTRISPPRARHLRQLENEVILLNKIPNTKACVVTAGLIYGNTFSYLELYFQSSLVEHNPLVCFGPGNNFLPMIHITDLAKSIELLTRISSTKANYIAVDNSTITQLEFLNILKKQILSQQEIEFKQLDYVTQIEAKMSANVKLMRSSQLDQIEWKSKELISNILDEFLMNREFKFQKIVIVDDITEGYEQNLQKMCKQNKILLLNHKSITDYLVNIEQNKPDNQDIILLIAEERRVFEEQRLAKVAQLQQEKKILAKKKVGKSDTKLKSASSIPHQLIFSNDLIKNGLVLMINENIYKSIIVDLSSEAVKHLPILQSFKEMTFDQMQQAIFPNKKDSKSRVNITVPEATRRCSYGGVSIQHDMDEIVSQEGGDFDDLVNYSQKKMNHRTSKKSLAEDDRMKRNVNCRQYLMDLVMPAVSYALNEIQTTRPNNMMETFIKMLREQAEDQDCIYT